MQTQILKSYNHSFDVFYDDDYDDLEQNKNDFNLSTENTNKNVDDDIDEEIEKLFNANDEIDDIRNNFEEGAKSVTVPTTFTNEDMKDQFRKEVDDENMLLDEEMEVEEDEDTYNDDNTDMLSNDIVEEYTNKLLCDVSFLKHINFIKTEETWYKEPITFLDYPKGNNIYYSYR